MPPQTPFRLHSYLRRRTFAGFGIALAVVWLTPIEAAPATSTRREIQRDDRLGQSGAVAVDEVALVHTASFMAQDRTGALLGRGDVVRQADEVLNAIERALALGGSGLDSVVKLNLSVAEPAMIAPVRGVLSRRFSSRAAPAVTLVVGAQTLPDAWVSGDAIGVARKSERSPRTTVEWLRSDALFASKGQSHAAVLPAGSRIYFSGKGGKGKTAETAATLMKATNALMEFVQTAPREVVHVTVLMKEMYEAPQAAEALKGFFGGECPPIAYLERNSGEGAMEIEVLAAGKPADANRREQVEYLTPPALRSSPMFSQITRINRGGSIFVSGTYGDPTADPEAQAVALFAKLEERIRAGGGDFQHLAKAMYHITGREAGIGMDKIRPKVYAPDRPPAASRNTLSDVGLPGAVMVVDLIGVVREK